MSERFVLYGMYFSLPFLAMTLWRAVDAETYAACLETPIIGMMLRIYQVPAALFVLLVLLFLMIGLIGKLGGWFVRPGIEVNSDGDFILPAVALDKLKAQGRLEISLSFNAPHRGLIQIPVVDTVASFAVCSSKQDHDDADIVEWFARRFRIDPVCIQVDVVGNGVQQQFRRIVTWSRVD